MDLIKKETAKVVHEHSIMMSKHFEFKTEYERAIDNSIEYFKRDKINIKEDLWDSVVKDLTNLDFLNMILSPLFIKDIPKGYDINSVFTPQKSKIVQKDTSTKIALEVDKEEQMIQKRIEEENNREKLQQYENILEDENILEVIFRFGAEVKQDFLLSEFIDYIQDEEEFITLTQNMYQLREVLIELLDEGNLDIGELKREASMLKSGYDNSGDFQPLKAILYTIKKNSSLHKIKSFKLTKTTNLDKVKITMDFMELTVNNIHFKFNL